MRLLNWTNPLRWRNPFYWLNPYYWVPPKDTGVSEGWGRRVTRVLMIVLHVFLVLAIVGGLWYVNHHYQIGRELLSPFPRLHAIWLPLLFVLLYAGAWLGYYFFRLLLDARSGEFPDIDMAWGEALSALDRAGIDPTEAPIFLVIGKPKSTTADFFAASKLPFAVKAEPRRGDAPLHVYANRDAIFVTCEGASVLAKFSDLLMTQRTLAAMKAKAPAAAPKITDYGFQSVNLLDSPAAGLAVTSGEFMLPESKLVTSGSGSLNASDWLPKPTQEAFLGVPDDEVQRQAARLRYLGSIISDRRRPYCPLNGIIWLVPMDATESQAIADQAAAACREDVQAVLASLQVQVPAVAVICDAQDLPGFSELLAGLPAAVAQERLLGRSFPLVPNVSPAERAGVFLSGITWMTRSMLPGVVYQRFGSEVEGNGSRWSDANARMWLLTSEMTERRPHLARLLAQGFADEPGRPPMLAGAYLAGTGPDVSDQAFVAGVIQQIVSLQNSVAWTPEAEAEEADYRRMTWVGYFTIVIAVIAVGWMAYRAWFS